MGKWIIDDSVLPKWETGGSRIGRINWKECVGLKVKFNNEECYVYIDIIEYYRECSKLKVKYNDNYECVVSISRFKDGCINSVLNNPNYIIDKAPWMCDLGVSIEDAKKYTYGSGANINVICPNCGNSKNVRISHIYECESIGCSCGDGKSYPEKFVTSLLNQLSVKFYNEVTKNKLSWCDKYRYDFYIPQLNCIIETHGEQHYKETTRGRSLKEEQENDKFKKELALQNGIKHYIEIDCRKDDLNWIKSSIINSGLNKLLKLDNINWNKCEQFSLKNIVKEVCDYWNNKQEHETTTDLGIVFKLDRHTISRYLKKGNKIGLCNYDSKEIMVNSGLNLGVKNKKIVMVYKKGELLGEFESSRELDKQSKELFGVRFDYRTISAVCLGKQKHYKGYEFKYKAIGK